MRKTCLALIGMGLILLMLSMTAYRVKEESDNINLAYDRGVEQTLELVGKMVEASGTYTNLNWKMIEHSVRSELR